MYNLITMFYVNEIFKTFPKMIVIYKHFMSLVFKNNFELRNSSICSAVTSVLKTHSQHRYRRHESKPNK